MFKVSNVEVMKFEEVKCFYVFKAGVVKYIFCRYHSHKTTEKL